jgi:hypothetical protein
MPDIWSIGEITRESSVKWDSKSTNRWRARSIDTKANVESTYANLWYRKFVRLKPRRQFQGNLAKVRIRLCIEVLE